MRKLYEIAADIKTHFRPLPDDERNIVKELAHMRGPDDGFWVGGQHYTAREQLAVLLYLLPAPTTESQRWLLNEIREVLAS